MPTLIGTGSNQVPTNGDLGTMAFQDSAAISVGIATVSGNVAVSGITTLNANVILGTSGLSANGGFGTAGQLLNSNGSATYWAADRSANAYTNAVAYVDGKSFVNTSQLSSNLANYQTTAGLSANVATLASNSATYANASISNTFTIGTSTYFVSNGNVGIGTNNPTTKLDIAGPIRSYNSKFANGATGTNLILRTSNVVGEMAALSFYSTFASGGDAEPRRSSDITSGYSTGAWGTEYLSFNVGTGGVNDNSNTTTERMRITGGGNVGIGNTNPDAKLAVTGTANVSGNVVIGGTLTTQSFVANTLGLYNTGTINAASFTIGTSTIANSTGVYTGVVNGSTLSVGTSVTANSTRLVIGTAVGLQANGGIGTSGQVLTSNGTTVYWGSTGASGTVTSVATGNGLTGGPISTTGTVSVLANNGITANSTGLFVTQGTGTVVNATGVHVNATYIGTLGVNSATYATYLGYTSANYGNTSGIFSTGTINAASHTVGTSTIANSSGIYASLVNIASGSITANSTKLVIGTGVGLQANGGVGTAGNILRSNGTSIYWTDTATLAANSAIYLGSSINFGNDSGIYTTGTINAASHTIGTSTVANTSGIFTNGTIRSETLLAGTIAGSNTVLTANSSMFTVRETVRARGFYSSANTTNLLGVGDIRSSGYSGQLYDGIFYISSNVGMPGGSALTSIQVANVANQKALQVQTGSNTTGSHAIAAYNTPSGGGQARIAMPAADGGYSFYSDAGTIGPFTASHDALIAKNTVFEMGDIVTDKTVLVKKLSDVITSVELAVNQCNNPIGVLIKKIPTSETHIPAAFVNSDGSINQLWNQIKNDYDYVIMNSVGEGCINVVGEGGEIFAGDLLVASSIPGKAMKQSDDIIRNKTIAKARENIKLNPGETAQIACIYLCG